MDTIVGAVAKAAGKEAAEVLKKESESFLSAALGGVVLQLPWALADTVKES